VDRQVREAITKSPKGKLAGLARDSAPGREAHLLVEALKSGDKAAQEILANTTRDLAFGLSHVVHLFHPEIIVLGGGLSNLGKPFQQAVQGHLETFVMEAFRPPPRIMLTELREDAVPVGALLLAAHRPRGQRG
jgi:glucokinase